MKEKISGVYCICNLQNNKKYIGSSKDIIGRVKNHYSELKAGRHRNQYLQRAWVKYGANSFEWLLIERTSNERSDILDCEQKWINYYTAYSRSCGYNIIIESSSKRSIDFSVAYDMLINGLYVFNEKQYQKIIYYFTQTHLSFYEVSKLIDVKVRILRDIFNGLHHCVLFQDLNFISREQNPNRKILSEDDVNNIIPRLLDGESAYSLAKAYDVDGKVIGRIKNHKTWKHLTEGIVFPKVKKGYSGKPVLQYNKNGKLIAEYKTITEASITTKINLSNINEASSEHRNVKTAGGFVWILKKDIAKFQDINKYIDEKFYNKGTSIPTICETTGEMFNSIIDAQKKYGFNRDKFINEVKKQGYFTKFIDGNNLVFKHA